MSADLSSDRTICVVTQTPLVQFQAETAARPTKGAGDGVDLFTLVEGEQYRYSPGGVTRIVLPLLRRMIQTGQIAEAHWVSLNPSGPPLVRMGAITLHHLSLGQERLASYGSAKETIWAAIHGTQGTKLDPQRLFWTDDYSEYAYYNRRCAELARRLDAEHDFDLFYIHDFQQLPLGRMLGTLKPKVFRWHVPFDESSFPAEWREPISGYLNGYDVIIASSDRYLESLKAFGYQNEVRLVYPSIDPDDYSRPTKSDVARIASTYGIERKDQLALVVARMDPMKGQDRAVTAMGTLATRFPRLKLLLVGNGSFSSSKEGIGLSKGAQWRTELEEQVKRAGLERRVIFAGHVEQRALDALFERAQLTVLPSLKEGFGLVVLESWLHRKPVVVSKLAGVAELVRDGKNGLLCDPEQPLTIAHRIGRLLRYPDLARRLGESGFATSRQCWVDATFQLETNILARLTGGLTP